MIFTGKWFNYGIIVFVMMLDLNMWKNQIIYTPLEYGQYIHPQSKRVYTVEKDSSTDPDCLLIQNSTNSTLKPLSNDTESLEPTRVPLVWNYETRSKEINPVTNKSFVETDLLINSRYLGYPSMVKALAFIPIAVGMFPFYFQPSSSIYFSFDPGFIFFFTLIYLYGRFPPKTDKSIGGRLKKRVKSSWRRERREGADNLSPSRLTSHPLRHRKEMIQYWSLPKLINQHPASIRGCNSPAVCNEPCCRRGLQMASPGHAGPMDSRQLSLDEQLLLHYRTNSIDGSVSQCDCIEKCEQMLTGGNQLATPPVATPNSLNNANWLLTQFRALPLSSRHLVGQMVSVIAKSVLHEQQQQRQIKQLELSQLETRA